MVSKIELRCEPKDNWFNLYADEQLISYVYIDSDGKVNIHIYKKDIISHISVS